VNTIPGVTFRPIHQWPGPMTPANHREPGYRFKATWSSTIELLGLELRQLGARDIVLQLDLEERDIRLDGLPRAHANPGHPGVILAFEAPSVGPLQFACDTYQWWETNVRAIALTLQALRAVERYGATKTGEQYRGWQALPPPAVPGEAMTLKQAARFIAEHSTAGGYFVELDDVLGAYRQDAYRAAARRLHPDAGGSHEAFTRLQQAKRILDQHGEVWP
jgi:hypothetical protein